LGSLLTPLKQKENGNAEHQNHVSEKVQQVQEQANTELELSVQRLTQAGYLQRDAEGAF